jgi:tetratricopeptide (TPR) repeat protein
MKTKAILMLVILASYLSINAQLTLDLLVNNTSEDTIIPGNPVVLTLKIYNAHSEYQNFHNQIAMQNLDILKAEFDKGHISEKYYEKEVERIKKTIKEIDVLNLTYKTLITGLEIAINDDTIKVEDLKVCTEPDLKDDPEILISAARLTLSYGFGPETTLKWEPGKYVFAANYNEFKSNSASLIIQNELPVEKTEYDILIETALYHINCGDPFLATGIAEQMLATDPENIDALILKADAGLALGDKAKSLELYRKALELFYLQYPDIYEPPMYLLMQIADLERD